MTDKEKLEKIRSEVIWYIHLRNEGIIIGSCGDFEKLLKFIDSIQEEPKKCMYTKDNYTDNDRKTLCDGCEEKCEYAQKEADWLQELHCKLDSLSKEDFEKVWARYHQKEEPISEDLEEAASEYLKQNYDIDNIYEEDDLSIRNTFKAGAQWQKQQDQSVIELAEDHAMLAGMEKMKEQMLAKAVDGEVKVDAGGYPYVDATIELYDYDKDIPLAKRGDKVKILVIKED